MVIAVCFNPDGTRLASARSDGKIKLWDGRSGAEVLTLAGDASAVCFSPDGTRLASVEYENAVKMWEAFHDEAARRVAKARRMVVTLFATPLRQREVIDRIVNGTSFPVDLQPVAIEIARAIPDDADRFAIAALERSYWPHGTPGFRREALAWAETAHQLAPQSDRAILALAAARMRLGEAATAIKLLGSMKKPPTEPKDICLVALAHHAAGQTLQTRAWLHRAYRHRQFTPSEKPPGDEAVRAVYGHVATDPRQAAMTRDTAIVERVAGLLAMPMLKGAARPALETAVDLSADERRFALAALDFLPSPSPKVFNSKARNIVVKAGAPGPDYRKALTWAEHADREQPKSRAIINTLGVAYYRCGMYAKALETLSRSEKLNTRDGVPNPVDLAFLAMSQHQLQRVADAKATLARARAALAKRPGAEAAGLVREAEALIEGKATK